MDKLRLDDEFFRKYIPLSEERLLAAIPLEVNHLFSEKFEKAIGRLIRQARRPPAVNAGIRCSRRAALGLLAALLAAFAVTMSVGAWRQAFFRFVEQHLPQFLLVSLEPMEETDAGQVLLTGYLPGWLPEGFSVLDSYCEETGIRLWSSGMDGKYLQYWQYPASKVTLMTDPQAAAASVEINGGEGRIYRTKGAQLLMWQDDGSAYAIYSNLDRDTMRRVAENLEPAPKMFRMREPGYVPEGMRLKDAQYGDRMRLIYGDDRGHSLFFQQMWRQQGEPPYASGQLEWTGLSFRDGRAAQKTEQNGYRVIAWTEEGYDFYAAANLEMEELLRVAESLQAGGRKFILRELKPEGYHMKNSQMNESAEILYENAQGETLLYRQDSIAHAAIAFYEANGGLAFNLSGRPGFYFEFGDSHILLWYDEKYFYQIFSKLDKAELIKVAETQSN